MKYKKILVNEDSKYYYDSGDVHTEAGQVKEQDILTKNQVITNKGKKLRVMNAGFNDNLEKIKRGPQVMINKDIGMILVNTNIDKNSVVIEAGTGNGALTLHLARFVKHIYSYEIREDHYEIAKKNVQAFGFDNITLKNRDITKGIQEKNVDLVVLDLPNPEEVRKKAYEVMKSGAYLVVYVPQITQAKEFVETSRGLFFIEKIVEVLEREWVIDKNICRPKHQILGHTAFLVLTRKV